VKLTRERAVRPAPPPPLEANDQLVTAVGTAGWAVALVVLLFLRSSLPAEDRWWIWTCVTGLAMGLFGYWYVPRLKRARAGRAAHGAQSQSAPRDNGSNTVSSTDTPGRSTRS
jgi:hypothetical protein